MTTREISKLVKFYNEQIKANDEMQQRGIYKTILNLLAGGITQEQLEAALRNYRAYQCDPHYRKGIRSFFTRENILLWQRPHPSTTQSVVPTADHVEYELRIRTIEDHEPATESF